MKAFYFTKSIIVILFFFLTAAMLPADEPSRTFKIDFTKDAGTIKPLHGINNSPVTYGKPLPELTDAGIPFVRLHDTAGAFGGTHFVDIPNIFPDFDADPNDPASYDFAFTDAYLKGLTSSGVKIFYRLGVTIENHHAIKAYRIHPPKDFEKFARICEGVIRHYNEGWADGFQYNIEYWEIWNEPENPPMWTGTREEYFELYRVTANHLKKAFPNLKIGGYASCGFYAATRNDCNEFYQSFLTYFDAFLQYISDEKTKAPLDFFSWHLYTADPEEIIRHADYADSVLKKYGFGEVENIFDEWNYTNRTKTMFDDMKEMPGAAFVASAFCLMQNSPIDMALYYDALPPRTYGGLYYFPSQKVTKTYWSFWMFNKLYRLGTAAPAVSEGETKCFALAAKNDDGEMAILIVNNEESAQTVKIETLGADLTQFQTTRLDAEHICVKDENFHADAVMKLAPKSVLLLTR